MRILTVIDPEQSPLGPDYLLDDKYGPNIYTKLLYSSKHIISLDYNLNKYDVLHLVGIVNHTTTLLNISYCILCHTVVTYINKTIMPNLSYLS